MASPASRSSQRASSSGSVVVVTDDVALASLPRQRLPALPPPGERATSTPAATATTTSDDHRRCADRRSGRSRRPAPSGAARSARSTARPVAVVGAQGRVVVVVEVAGVVLALEVLERPHEEALGRGRSDSGSSASLTTAHALPRARRRTARPPAASTTATTGRTHTSAGDARGGRRQQDLVAVAAGEVVPDLVVGLARLDPLARSRRGWPAAAGASLSAADWLRHCGHRIVAAMALHPVLGAGAARRRRAAPTTRATTSDDGHRQPDDQRADASAAAARQRRAASSRPRR